MKKYCFLSLIAFSLIVQSSLGMEQPSEDRKEIQELRDQFEKITKEVPSKSRTPQAVKELVLTTAQLRTQISPDEDEAILKKAKNAYNQFKKDTRQSVKPELYGLQDEFSDQEKEPMEPYDDLKKKLELKDCNQQKITQFETVLKQLEQKKSSEQNELQKLENKIIDLKALYQKKQEQNKSTKQQINENTNTIKTIDTINNYLLGIANVKKLSLEEHYKKIQSDIENNTKQVTQTQEKLNNNNDDKPDFDEKATLKNQIEKFEETIKNLEKDKQKVHTSILKAHKHFKGKSTLGLNWFPWFSSENLNEFLIESQKETKEKVLSEDE